MRLAAPYPRARMESAVITLPSNAQSVKADKTVIPLTTISFVVPDSTDFPMDLRTPLICKALRIRLGIIRSTITSSSDRAGIRLPKRLVNLSDVSTSL